MMGSILAVIFASLLLFIHVVFGVVFSIAFIWLIVRGEYLKNDRDKNWCIDERWGEPWCEDDLWGDEQTIREPLPNLTLSGSFDGFLKILVEIMEPESTGETREQMSHHLKQKLITYISKINRAYIKKTIGKS